MAPIHDPDKGVDREWVFQRLEDLYKDGVLNDDDGHEAIDTKSAPGIQNILSTPNGYDPSITIPNIINYLRDNDAGRDANWKTNFTLIRGYLADTHRRMVTGSLGFGDSNLRAALEDARVMVKVHLNHERRAQEKTRWTDSILRGQITQKRLLTYPKVFPLPEPDRSKSQYRPMKPMPRPDDNSPLWNTTLKVIDPAAESSILVEVDNYVDNENRFFQFAMAGSSDELTWENNRFVIENRAYEEYMNRGPAGTCANPPSPHNDGPTGSERSDNPDGTKGPPFYRRRGWQRAALQQCLNLFTSHENRVINTPWRRPVFPYDPPAALPRDIAYVPRVTDHRDVKDEKVKDPFSWLHWSSQHAQVVNFLATCQHRNYNRRSWDDFSAPALPTNFRGPRIYRGLTVHDQHWLKIGDYLEKLENLLHSAWGAAPRPFLRAILRDIDAGRHENTGGPNMDNSHYLPAEDDDDIHDRKRYWRRDIQRRVGIDCREENTNDDNFKLLDDFDIAWLRYLCEPSRTVEMCDSSKLPSHNLAIIFDAKLQSYFNNLEVSGYPDSKALCLWGENYDDIDEVRRKYEPSTLRTVVAYINGCTDSELFDSGDRGPNPEHPNACYQYSLEEAEFLCVELQNLGRCVYIPERDREPAKVTRPSYSVHPEDRVRWRYPDLLQCHQANEEFLYMMVEHYDTTYGNWSLYLGNRPRFSRELEFMLDHTGPDFRYELERVETQEKHPATSAAFAKRRAFIRDYLAPEGLYRIGDLAAESIENERGAPHRDDLASWEQVGAYLTKYHEQHKDKHDHMRYYYPGDSYHPQTPERTVQFFRNLAYRAGRTMRYVDQIKERLQYLESDTEAVTPKAPLDLSVDLKEPRPEDNTSADAAPAPVAVEKWWQAISVKDYNSAIEKWNTSIQEGSGDMALLPPDIDEVLEKADPDAFLDSPEGQDPFTVIREGIIENCFQNRPTMYPGRLSGFKDQGDNEFQGYERPSLFDWATKDQRRYQAPHTRRHFFNMQRWPPSRILPHRLEAIRARKDEVARIDPSQPDQAYGILTNRVPIGTEKPLYAHPLIHHGPDPDNDWRNFPRPRPDFEIDPTLLDPSANLVGNKGKVNDYVDKDQNDPDFFDVEDLNTNNNTDKDQNDPDFFDVDLSENNNTDKDQNDPDFFDVDLSENNNTNKPQNSPGNFDFDLSINIASIEHDFSNIHNLAMQYNQDDEFFDPVDTNTGNGNTMDTGGATAPTGPMGPTGSTGPLGPKTTPPTKPTKGGRGRGRTMTGLVPFTRTNRKFAPGPAVFPMGDTLLQKVLISQELNNALYPEKPFYRRRLLGLQKVFKKVITSKALLVPLVPPTARSNIPRSNPRKRKMPIEFLNGSTTTKKFRSDKTVPLQPGGNGGQFGAGTGCGTGVGGSGVGGSGGCGSGGGGSGGCGSGGTGIAEPEKGIFDDSLWNQLYSPLKTTATGGDTMTETTKPKKPKKPTQKTQTTQPTPDTAVQLFESPGVLPTPSLRRARDTFNQQFGRVMWTATQVDYLYLYSSACVSLSQSIEAQTTKTKLHVEYQALADMAKSQPEFSAIHTYIRNNNNDYFDINCLAYLLQVFGEKHGEKLQLGVVQEDPNKTQKYPLPSTPGATGKGPYAASLAKSPYDMDPDKIVIWVQVRVTEHWTRRLVSPYSKLEYNTYDAIYQCGTECPPLPVEAKTS
ncbi:hypothetical protein CHU98_g9227 [Xylaria longipes]|nr:hypothetical protein CHU98_g9227 [Xylaria longipes]